MNTLEHHLDSAYKRVLEYGPKLASTYVPYCAVGVGGRPMSDEEWLARMDQIKDDFNLCFFGTSRRTPADWRRELGWTWTPTSDVDDSKLVQAEGMTMNLYGFMCLYEPWITQTLGNEPQLYLPKKDPKAPPTTLQIDMATGWDDLLSNYRAFYDTFSFTAGGVETDTLQKHVSEHKGRMDTLKPDTFTAAESNLLIKSMGEYMHKVNTYMAKYHSELLRASSAADPNPAKRTKNEKAAAYDEMQNRNRELSDHFYHMKAGVKTFIEYVAEAKEIKRVQAVRDADIVTNYNAQMDMYRRRVRDKSTLITAIRAAVLNHMRNTSAHPVQPVRPKHTPAYLKYVDQFVQGVRKDANIPNLNEDSSCRFRDGKIFVEGVMLIDSTRGGGMITATQTAELEAMRTLGDFVEILLKMMPPDEDEEEEEDTSSSSSVPDDWADQEGDEEAVVPTTQPIESEYAEALRDAEPAYAVQDINRVRERVSEYEDDGVDEMAAKINSDAQALRDEIGLFNTIKKTRGEDEDGEEEEDDAMYMPRFVSVRR